jgi:GNAT superfamily N-acetyltransferase
MPDSFSIRRATAHDAEIVASHRARMFQDMGEVSGDAFETLRGKARVRIAEWIERGDYAGWLASPVDQPEVVVAGAGIQLHPILPRPLTTSKISEGRQGTIVNVFTEPEWRRRGIGSLLMQEIIAWSKREGIDRLLLHASADGRSIYEKLGFIESNEMRFVGES